MKKVNDIFDAFDRIAFFIAQIATMIMMVLTTADAIMRYGFNKPIIGAYHFSEKYLMIIIVFLSMSYAMKLRGHIQIDLFTDKMPIKLKNFFQIIYSLLAAGLMFLIGYLSLGVTIEAFTLKYTSTGIIPWPTWLSWVWVPIGAFLFMMRLVLHALNISLHFNHKLEDVMEIEDISE